MPASWTGVGRSADPDARLAGRAATEAALTHPDPRLLLVFAAPTYDLAALAAGVREAADQTLMIGCSTAGEIGDGWAGEGSVVVMAIGGSGVDVRTTAVVGASRRLRAAGAEAATLLTGMDDGEHRLLLLLTDSVSRNPQEVIRGVYRVLGAGTPLVGGCAGDGGKIEQSTLLRDGEVFRGALVAAAITSRTPLGIGVSHGWRRTGEPLDVTRSVDRLIYELDERPALDVYLDRLGAPKECRHDPRAFLEFAFRHPIGVRRPSGEAVRVVATAHYAERAIGCVGEVPQGSLAWLMHGDTRSMLDATDVACTEAVTQLDGRPPTGLLVFDCFGRRQLLGEDGVADEVARITTHAAGAPVAGFYSYGEIARTHGINGFHNQTVVVLALS